MGFRILGCFRFPFYGVQGYSAPPRDSIMANDKRKTKARLIAELEEMRQENAGLRQQMTEDDMAVVKRRLVAEQVRAETMAMQKSDDLLKIVGQFFQGIKDLGVETSVCGIYFLDEKVDRLIDYRAFVNPKKYGISWTSPELIEFSEDILVSMRDQVLSEAWSNWQGSEGQKHWHKQKVHTYVTNINREISENWLKRIGATTSTSFEPFISERIGAFAVTNVPFKYGMVGFRKREYCDEHVAIVREFTEALSLGYLRFLDFQRLEEQNRNLLIERSLERVRAEVAAMREGRDLSKIVRVVKQVLKELGMSVDSIGINIIDDTSGNIRTYSEGNTTEYGLHDAMEDRESYKNLYGYWKGNRTWHRFFKHADRIQEWFQAGHEGATEQEVVEGAKNRYNLTEQEIQEWLRMGRTSSRVQEAINGGLWIVDVPFAYGTLAMRKHKGESFSEDEIHLLERFTEVFALGYTRFLDFQKVDEAQKKLIDELEEELQTAHDMQMRLMPTEAPKIPGFEIVGHCLPANHVGGDFFQYFPQNGRLSISLADVTGHAMEAAVPVMMFSGILKSQMEIGGPVEEIFGRLNRSLHGTLDKRTFVCFTMGELDTETRTFHLANGGCPYPYHFQASTGEISELQLDAYPLAIRSDSEYETMDIQLNAGDRIIFCSDGIIEAENAGEEMFGFERTAETIRQGCREDLSAEALIDHLIGAVKAFAGETPQGDDMTVVVLKVGK